MKNKSRKKGIIRWEGNALFSLIAFYICVCAFVSILAVLIQTERIPENGIQYMGIPVLGFSVLTALLLCLSNNDSLAKHAACGVAISLTNTALYLIVPGDEPSKWFIPTILIVIVSVLSFFLRNNRRKEKANRKKRHRNR